MAALSHTLRGKWSQDGVPHRGWMCLEVYDLEEPSALCAMCETAEVRYVHCMQHGDYPEVLEVRSCPPPSSARCRPSTGW